MAEGKHIGDDLVGMERSVTEAMKRELRVAFSRRAQPIWFRVLKWTILLASARRLRGTGWLGPLILGGGSIGIALHLVYRRMTDGWTRPWGGWHDLAAASGSR